jgi:restriction system protein
MERAAIADQRRRVREAIREQREQVREDARREREAKKQYLEDRADEAASQNEDLASELDALSSILQHTLSVDDAIPFASLKVAETFPAFVVPEDLAGPPDCPERERYLADVQAPSWFGRLFPFVRRRYEQALREAEQRYQGAMNFHSAELRERTARLQAAQSEHEKKRKAFLAKAQDRNREVNELEQAYRDADPAAVVTYNTMVLERSEYPDECPQEFRLAFSPSSHELVVEYVLPTVDIVPSVAEYRYNKSKDTIEEKPRKQAEIRERYQDIVAAISLRTIHEVFEADQGDVLKVVTFNGMIETVDPATGKDIRPCLVSVRATKEHFLAIDLARVDKGVCLRNLGAQVSSRADEAQAVKPIVEFDMVDNRFVDQADMLAGLEARPNLMALNPSEFENLVSNLFSKMGLDTKLTRASRDGGVDAVAFDTRPIVGGKVVIQSKRYRNTVGVSAVRDLYGTMMNEGANKGILVATSGYGPDAHEFAKDKPIELVDGGGLLYLLEQVGVRARIVMPDEGVGD